MWRSSDKKKPWTLLLYCTLAATETLWMWRSHTLAQDARRHFQMDGWSTRCLPVLMLDLNDRLGGPRADEST